MAEAYPEYPLAWGTGAAILWDALVNPDGRHRSFRGDAEACVARIRPPVKVDSSERVAQAGSCLLTVNHYSRPGFRAWWIALAISAASPMEIHWTMTAAWTYPDAVRSRLVTPLTRWAFSRIARIYGFASMPPMPPDPREAASRAVAVRRVLAYVRRTTQPVVGLAPEGSDAPGGALQFPPPGVGRFMLHLAHLGLNIVPVGCYEQEGALHLRFGSAYQLAITPAWPADDRDREASRIAMRHIAEQLPARLRGAFA